MKNLFNIFVLVPQPQDDQDPGLIVANYVYM